MAFAALKEELTCSICLNVYTDPVLLRCGHNFCRVCIDHALDSQEASGGYSCPDCRGGFMERSALQSNRKLCNIVEYLHSTQPAPAEAEIICSNCIESAVPAVISCLHCEVLLCDHHLRVHSKSPEHVLMEPCSAVRIRRCPSHQKALVYYCCDEKSCICVSCLLNGKHMDHQVIDINEAFKKKMETLRSIKAKGAEMVEEVEQKIQTLQAHKKRTLAKSASLIKLNNITFKEIRRQLDVLSKRVQNEIARREEQKSLSISDLIQQLDIMKDDLSRRMRHMEKLCNSTDPLTLLQDGEIDGKYFLDTGHIDLYQQVVTMTNDEDDLDENVISKMTRMGLSGIMGDAGVTKYCPVDEATEIFLDVNTAANNICVSGDLKTASCSDVNRNRPETPERFDDSKVMNTRSFTSGEHYWDMDTSTSGGWRVGVAYASMERRGNISFIGKNSKSLGLRRLGDRYFLRLNDNEIHILHKAKCGKIRIHLDYDAGRVSFYEMSDPMVILYTHNTTFTQPLHAVFSVFENGWVRIRN
ncbi:hypothetical protein GDO81_022855 [Engystomops pustulosus]|uniref:Uncharacterized protein n=1 Tax=Engystomops pustulosus TaxID=76066 RepID=A0AAV6YT78_ENGPU|nr:hypothetical protein GDO81_022855 [Engystomops pustulosus]